MKHHLFRGALALIAICSSSCSLLGNLPDVLESSVDKAVAVIDHGISDITGESTSWRNVLQRVANDLPADISSTIRNDAQNLATRSIAEAGTEIRCNVDFLAARAITQLKALKAKLLNQAPPLVPPGFCHVSPNAIELSSLPATWSRIQLDGYDMDQKDAAGKTLQVMMLDGSGATRPLPVDRIGMTTHYQVTLNMGGLEKDLYYKNIKKLLVSWSGNTSGHPEVVVVPWSPRQNNVDIPASTTSYTPPRVHGDGDFDTDDDEPMTIEVQGELSVTEQQIKSRVYMKAREPRPDYTEATGYSPWSVLYTAPLGWKIVSVTPRTTSRQTGNITDHNRHEYTLPAGEVVRTFEVWGDRDGDEAGSYTRMVAHWNSFHMLIQETQPVWTLSTSP